MWFHEKFEKNFGHYTVYNVYFQLDINIIHNMHWYTVQWVKHDVGRSLWVKWVPIWKVWKESEKVGKSQRLNSMEESLKTLGKVRDK